MTCGQRELIDNEKRLHSIARLMAFDAFLAVLLLRHDGRKIDSPAVKLLKDARCFTEAELDKAICIAGKVLDSYKEDGNNEMEQLCKEVLDFIHTYWME